MKDRRRNPGYSRYTNQLFMSQLSAEECGVFQEKLFKFRGFYIQRRTIRQYSYNAAAHALGDIGEVSAKEMEADEEGYYIRGDYVGKLESRNRMKSICVARKELRFCFAMRTVVSRDIIWMVNMTVLPFPART